MHKTIVLTDPHTAAVFRLTDFEVRVVPEPEDAGEALRAVLSEDFAVVFMTEGLAVPLREEIRRVQEQAEAVLAIIPGIGPSERLGRALLEERKRAVLGG